MPCLDLHAHMLDIMSMVIPYLDPHVCTHVLCSYAYAFTCLYAWIHVLPCLYANFLYVYTQVSMSICLDLGFHMPVCWGLCSLHALCACALHAMFVCLDLGYVCHAMYYYSPFIALSFFPMFWPNGSDPIQTLWFLSSSVHLGPYQRVWITSIYMSMLACFYVLCLY